MIKSNEHADGLLIDYTDEKMPNIISKPEVKNDVNAKFNFKILMKEIEGLIGELAERY